MIRLTIIFSAAALLFISLSCERMVTEEPYGVYSNTNFFVSGKDALAAVLYSYDALNYIEYESRARFDLFSAPTQEMSLYGKGDTPDRNEMVTWSFTPSNHLLTNYFKFCYLSVTRANNALENIALMNDENILERERNQYMGEAYFLRAYNYFNLVRGWGSVPIRTKIPGSIEDLHIAYSSIEDVYTLVIDDLETAIGMMEIQKMQGRADKVAAQSLLAKVYLTLASSSTTGSPGYEWVSDAADMYNKAAEYAGDVINNQTDYHLDPDLLGLYEVENHGTSPEHIFMLSQNRDLLGQEGNFSQMPQMFVIGGGLQTVYVNGSLENDPGDSTEIYPMLNLGSWSVFRTDSVFYSSFSDDDLRKKLFVSEIYNADGSLLATWSPDNIHSEDPVKNAFYFPFCRKYSDPLSETHKTSANPYLIRFAEVALIYAEAAGPTTEGYNAINQVRERAGLPELSPGLSVDAFREAVLLERKYELAFEGDALLDLRRTNRVNNTYIPGKNISQEYAYFYPIPQIEQDLNQ
ncbi:MAG: RagB/SusD family nutrient uptake outer membrane protein [Bacteroidota bacterium]